MRSHLKLFIAVSFVLLAALAMNAAWGTLAAVAVVFGSAFAIQALNQRPVLGVGITNRLLTDAQLSVSKAHPAAGANNSTAGINLGQTTIFPVNEKFEAVLSVPALPSLVDAKTVIYTFQDSADGITFAAIPELATLTLTGAGGVGAAAATRTVRLPSSCRQYINVNAAVLAAGGDNTAVSYTLALKF